MNTQLLLCVVIVLVFFVLMFSLCKTQQKESFMGNKDYPDKRMISHEKFLYNKSNTEIEILKEINNIADSVSDIMDNDDDEKSKLMTSSPILFKVNIDLVITKITYNLMKKYVDENGEVFTSKLELYLAILTYYRYILEDSEFEKLIGDFPEFNQRIDRLINLASSSSDVYLNKFMQVNEIERIINEVKINIKNIKDEILVSKNNKLEFINYNSIKQKNYLSRLIKKMLKQIFFNLLTKINSKLACPLYDDKSCPVSPYSGVSSDNKKLTEMSKKFPCSLDTSFDEGSIRKNPMCVNSSTNQNFTDDCQIMDGYGKQMCDSTFKLNDNNTISKCQYENLTERCVNPDRTDILNTKLDENNEVIDEDFKNSFTRCHDIYNKNPKKMENMCKFLGCGFENVTDIENNELGFCYSEDKSKRPKNFCVSISNLKVKDSGDNDIPLRDKLFNTYCEEDPDISTNYDESNPNPIKYYRRTGDTDNDLSCSMFDNSDNKIDKTLQNLKKEDSLKTNLNSISNQRAMCENFNKDSLDISNKCEFVEYNKPISNAHNSKYDKLTMCVPKGSVRLPNSLIKEKIKCKDGAIWSEENKICVNPLSGCNQFKHKETCNLIDTCLWTSGSNNDTLTDNFEYGMCKDISHSLNDVETMIDHIHNNNLKKYVELSNLEEKLDKILPMIKTNLSSI